MLNAGIGAGAEEILIPEENMGLERLLESLKRSEKSGENFPYSGYCRGDKTGENVFEIASYIEKNLPYYEVRVSVLGHMQREALPVLIGFWPQNGRICRGTINGWKFK